MKTEFRLGTFEKYLQKKLGIANEGVVSIARLFGVYMIAGGGYTVAGGGDEPSVFTAFAKCLPILLFALLTGHKAWVTRCAYAGLVTVGLLLSAVGDALLVWEQLSTGMMMFGLALLMYTAALPTWPLLPVRGALLAALAVAVVSQLRAPAAVARLLPLYAGCLWAAAWRGGAARGRGRGAAKIGLELFALSDICLACHMFYKQLPCYQLIVMGTYYTAQLLVAVSAVAKDLPLKQN